MPRIQTFLSFFVYLLVVAGSLRAQQSNVDNTPAVHQEFPFQMMWDDAVMVSAKSGKATAAFDLDLADSASVKLARTVIKSKRLQSFLRTNFEPALNDFASDPPPSVGLDSLRNLGWRLSGLEKSYGIVRRPCIIVIGANKQEVDRIVFPHTLSAEQLERQLHDISTDRNTLHSAVTAFWKDTTKIAARWKLIDMFEMRSKYDSVVNHLQAIQSDASHSADAKKAAIRLADLKLRVEGNPMPAEDLLPKLGLSDKGLHARFLADLLQYYKHKKKIDDVERTYDAMMRLAGTRDPEILNEEAWFIANESRRQEDALKLIDEALKARPNDPNYYDTRALIEANMDRYDDAIKDQERAISLAEKKDKKDFERQLEHLKALKQDANADPKEDAKEESNKKH